MGEWGTKVEKKLNHFFPLVLISNLNFRISSSKVSFNLPDLECQIFPNVVLKANKIFKILFSNEEVKQIVNLK